VSAAPTDPRGRRGIPFVVSGPSGAGKTTIERRVVEADPLLRFSVSHTTRPPRDREVDGKDYWFVDEGRFRQLIDEGRFVEWAEYQGQLYGTSMEALEGPTARGIDLILEVEILGARQLKERLTDAVFVFVLPPSMETLEQRLSGRGSDAEEAVRKRIERAIEEVREATRYDYVIVNEDLDRAVADLHSVIKAARLARDRVLPRLRDRFDFG
jgi:guanylate kinase